MIRIAVRTPILRRWCRLCSTEPSTALALVQQELVESRETQVPAETAAWGHLRSLGFEEEQVEQLTTRFPNLTRVSFQQPVAEKLAFLAEKGMNRRGMVRFFANVLMVYPEFLDLEVNLEIRPVFDYLSSLSLADEEILVMMIQFPHLVSYDVEEVFQPKVQYLREMEFDERQIPQMLFSFPQYFGVSLDGNIQPVVTYLTQEMDFRREELKKVFMKCPQLFGVRLEATRAKLDFLIEAGFEMSVIRALVKRFPAFLRASMKDHLHPTISILLEYAPKEVVQNVFYKCPQSLVLSYEQEILPKFRFFVELGYDPVDLRILLEQFPEVLCYSLEEEIMPTVERSIEVGLSFVETRITFAREPEIFRQSIAKVMKDRAEAEKKAKKLLTM